jgi:signal transduction histidine kinase
MSPRFSTVLLFGLAVLAAACPRLAAAPDPEAGLPFVDTFAPRDYRGHQQIHRTVEDAAGLLYFGNLNKVLVFDGAHWSHLAVPDATFIRGLAVDSADTLWIGGVDELGYAKTDPTGARTFVSLKDQLPAAARACGTIWNILLTPRGILFQTESWLLRYDGAAFTTLRLADSPRWRLTAIGAEAWATDSKHGWFRIRDDGAALTLDPLPLPPEFAGDRAVGAATTAAPGETLVATDKHGLWRWDGRAFTAFPTAIDAELRSRRAYSMTGLPDGRIAINSIQAGVWLLDAAGQLLAHLDGTNGLLDPTAIDVFPARDGTALWVGLARGVARVDVRPWVTWFHPANGAPPSHLESPIRFRGELLAPGDSAGVLRLRPATPTAPAALERTPISAGLVYELTVAHDRLIVSGAQGVGEVAPDGVTFNRLPEAPPNSNTFMPLAARPGVWAVLNNDDIRLFRRDATAGWRTTGVVPGITRVRSLVEDADGSWWHGRPSGGALHTTFPNGPDAAPKVETYTAPDGLPAGHGWTRLFATPNGPLLACNLGLFRFDATARRFRPTAEYGAALGDGSTYVNAAVADSSGGLFVIARPANDPEAGHELRLAYGRAGQVTPLHLPRLTQIDDPTHFLHEPAAAGRPETLWIAGHGALVRLDLDRWRAAPPAPPVRLQLRSLVTATGRALPLAGGWTLPFSDRSLRVRYSAPALAADPGATYETTLVTSSGPAVRTDQIAERDFTALAAGDYTLRVRARHPGGAWSPPATLAFRVLPPPWLSPLALAGYALAALLTLAALWRVRALRYLRRQHALEAAVAARTAEIAAQNAELVRLRQIEFDEKLAARLAEHKARLEVLRYQLNPHFLFNTLNAVCAQIIASPRTARDTVIRLAEFCRFTLHRPTTEEEPTLGEEIEMLRAYLDIEKTRLGELFDYTIASDPALARLRLPPFLLLPLVENAVKYGAATSRDRVRIRLAFHRGPDGRVLIEVANTGAWIPPTDPDRTVPSLGIGLENLRQRLTRYFPGKHEFTTEPTDGWVVARIHLDAP